MSKMFNACPLVNQGSDFYFSSSFPSEKFPFDKYRQRRPIKTAIGFFLGYRRHYPHRIIIMLSDTYTLYVNTWVEIDRLPEYSRTGDTSEIPKTPRIKQRKKLVLKIICLVQ